MDGKEKQEFKPKKVSKVVKVYSKIRSGKLFLIILCSFCTPWMAWNVLAPRYLQFDPGSDGYPLLTLLLSVEASIAASVIIMSNQENDALQREQLKYLLHQSEATLELLEKSTLAQNSKQE